MDLLAIVDGRIIIGEAKKGSILQEKAADELPWLRALAEIADAITADEVILATATTWKQNTLTRINEVFSTHRIRPRIVELGNGADIGSDDTAGNQALRG